MKALLFIPFIISTVLGGFLSGLSRTFDEVEMKMLDIRVTMPQEQVNNLLYMSQISTNDVNSKGAGNIPDFEYKDAVVVTKYNGKSETFEKVTFKTGGMYGRSNDKVGFNLKFDKKFLGRKSFKLRPDPNDESRLHSKLCCDIANKLGLPSIQATYARLYVNDDFWGLYVFMEAIKTSWIKAVYNPSEKEVSTLYQCKNGGFDFGPNSHYACQNANDDIPSMDAFRKFVSDANNARNASDLEKIMDVDVFLKYLALEWLIGSFDHFMIYGHNFNWYKRESDGKWVVIYYDYDNTFGSGLQTGLWSGKSRNQDGTNFRNDNQFVKYSFADWEKNYPILGKLVFQNQNKFKSIVREVLTVFNPTTLNAHINELKEYLTPYVKEDLVINSQGKLPGRINGAGTKRNSSVQSFENAVENKVKAWINDKFNTACSNYNFNKNDITSGSGSNSGSGSGSNTSSGSGSNTSSGNTSGDKYDILKNGKINDGWADWSWGASNKFDGQGNLVSSITSGTWGGASFKSDKYTISEGTLYFKAKTNDTSAVLSILLHNSVADEYVSVGQVKGLSTSDMKSYAVTIKKSVKYDRLTIQDANNRGLTLYLNDIYFVAGSGSGTNNNNNNAATTTTTTVKKTTSKVIQTTTTTTTVVKTDNSSATPSSSGTTYNILKNGKIGDGWADWSWGVEGNSFNGQGELVATIVADKWGGVSFKSDKYKLGSGTLYFQARANDANANLQILLHVADADEYSSAGTIKNISTSSMTKYKVNIKQPSGGKFDRITIQDANNRGVKVYLNNVYFVSDEGSTSNNNNNNNAPATTTTEKKVTTTTTTTIKKTTTKAAVTTESSERYTILKDGKIGNGWADWSWGVEGNTFNGQGQLVATIVADKWGGVSFKSDKYKLGAGTLYFQARVNDANANLQILLHVADADEYTSAGSIKNISTSSMTKYKVNIKEPSSGKYDRITIQDASNRGVKVYLDDIYFVPYSSSTKQVTENNNNNNTNTNTNSNNNNGNCAKAFSPCGGKNYSDVPTCCEAGYKCEVMNEYFHMCVLDA